jgi:hypothetical protein
MKEDITELRELPLELLVSAPLNAVIAAQANAAMTTVKFIEEVGFDRDREGQEDESFFDDLESNGNEYKVRVAKLKVEVDKGSGNKTITDVQIPLLSLFNVPSFEISNFDWSFNCKLKSVQSFSAKFKTESSTTISGENTNELSIGKVLKIGSKIKVETTTKTDFESRFKSGREQEYNLAISIRGNSAPLPRGIETLLSIAENAAKSSPVPPDPPPAP